MSRLLLPLLLSGAVLAAQQPPATEVYLATLTSAPGGALTVGAPVNISNSPGYDNQPAFVPDGSGVLFSSMRVGTQTDIYRYDLTTRQVAQLTRTDDNEYSPTMAPDGKTFTVVRGVKQELWRFDLDGSNPRLAYAHKGLIGYHAWIDAGHLAVFILGEQRAPATLQLVDVAAGTAEVVDTNIRRSLLIRPGRSTVSYIAMPAGGVWTINEIDPKTRAITPIVKPIDGVQDCAWLPDGALLMGQKTKLHVWRPGAEGWKEVADLAGAGLDNITRLAVSRDGRSLAIVAEPVSK